MGKRVLRLLVLVLAINGGLVQAFDALNQAKVHKAYEDGDFDVVVDTLAAFQKANPIHSRADSIFIAKHLAVVYAANPKTVEIGKHWMYRLLDLLPAADFAGMYVNEEIDRIFEKVRAEFLSRQHALGVDTSKIVLPTRHGKPAGDSSSLVNKAPSAASTSSLESRTSGQTRRKWVWIGVGGATVAAVLTTFLIVSDKAPAKSTTVVPVTL